MHVLIGDARLDDKDEKSPYFQLATFYVIFKNLKRVIKYNLN